MRILVVDDEAPMRLALVENLRAEGYQVESAGEGEEALEKVFASDFDLVLLDVMMPVLDGYATCAEMRKRGFKQPILILTARGMVDDRVKGLDSGADDYLIKPFSLKELLARVRAHTRRQERTDLPVIIHLGETVIHFQHRTCCLDHVTQDLSSKEIGILELLVLSRGEAISRDRFLDEVWGYHANPSTRTVDNFIVDLRKKLGPGGAKIKTVRGKGYRLPPEEISLPSGDH